MLRVWLSGLAACTVRPSGSMKLRKTKKHIKIVGIPHNLDVSNAAQALVGKECFLSEATAHRPSIQVEASVA